MRARHKPIPVRKTSKTAVLAMACLTFFSPFNLMLAAYAADDTTVSAKSEQAKEKAQEARAQRKQAAHALLSPPMKATLDTTPTTPPPKESPDPIAVAATPKVSPPSKPADSKSKAKELLREGTRQHRAGNLNDAEGMFKQAILLDPNNADGFYDLGAISEGRGDFLMALTNYRAGLLLRPNDADLKEAVKAMESKLAVNSPVALPNVPEATPSVPVTTPSNFNVNQYVNGNNFTVPARMFSNPDSSVSVSNPPIINVSPPDAATLKQYVYEPPVETSPGDSTFQLHSTQNGAAGTGPITAGSTSNWSPPTVSHNGKSRMAAHIAGMTLGAALGIGLGIGMSSAFHGGRGSLHCPRCRLLGF